MRSAGSIVEAVISQQLITEDQVPAVRDALTLNGQMRALFDAIESASPQNRVGFHLLLTLKEPELMAELGE